MVSITALRDDYDELIGYLLIGADNSVRKQFEAELTNAKAIAEKANLAKSDFLSNMSHELRSPLNAILGFAQLMASDATPQTESQKESTGQILQAGWYLLDLINEILDLALIESGKLLLSMEPMSLDEVMLDCQTMIEPQARQYAGVDGFPGHAEALLRARRPYPGEADPAQPADQRHQVQPRRAARSRSNARCASPERIRISVSDTGAGLAADKLAQLFQPFNRLGQQAGGEEGTGIGLVMTKRLIELMGGVIGVESTVGVGQCLLGGIGPGPQAAILVGSGRADAVAAMSVPSAAVPQHASICGRQSGQPEAGRAAHCPPREHAAAERRRRHDRHRPGSRAATRGDPDGH